MGCEKVVLFGAGLIGQMALKKLGENAVDFFVDNNASLQEKVIAGKKVLSPEVLRNRQEQKVIISSRHYGAMIKQLEDMGHSNFEVYDDAGKLYYPTNVIIFNPYQNNPNRGLTEEQYNDKFAKEKTVNGIRAAVDELYNKNLLFNHVEIETINRCNGVCEFCPVSVPNEKRVYAKMSDRIFEKIILELADMDYSGRIALFSNNEPFLDDDIIRKHRYAREKLPNAKFHLFTNGTLLTLDKFIEIIDCLDELVIDNYNVNLELISNSKIIAEYCEKHSVLKEKVTIVLRNPKEILSSRGGDAPNRKNKVSYPQATCVLPFKQMIIRSDGKVSLCCNDPLGKMTLGDVQNQTLLEIWNGDAFKMVREKLYKGRGELAHCVYCDVFSIG